MIGITTDAVHNVGIQSHSICVATKNRIASDCQCWVREDSNSVSLRRIGLATAYILANPCIIGEEIRIAINVGRLVNEHAVSNTSNFNTVTIPNIVISNITHALSSMSFHLNLTAVADRVVIDFDSNLRVSNSLHFDFRRVHTTACSLCSNEVISFIRSDSVHRSIGPLCSTVNHMVGIHATLVPLIGKTFNVSVVNGRGQSNLTAVTDRNNRIHESNNGSLTYVDFKSIAGYRTTTDTVRNCHIIDKRRVTSMCGLINIGVFSLNIGVINAPSIDVSHTVKAVIKMCCQIDIVFNALANILIASDNHCRHRSNDNRVKANQRSTTAAGLSSSYTINISSIGIGNSHRNISVVGIRHTVNHNTVLVPSIGIGFVIHTRLSISSRKQNFQTTANRIRNNVSNLNSGKILHMNCYRIHRCAETVANRFHFDHCISSGSKSISICGIRSIRDRITAEPLISHVFFTVSNTDKEFNRSVDTNGGIRNGDFRNRGGIDIDNERVAFNTAAVVARNKSCVSISTIGKIFCNRVGKSCQSSRSTSYAILIPSNLGVDTRII